MAQTSLVFCVTVVGLLKQTVANLTAEFVGYLPDAEIQGAAVYDGNDSVFFMGGIATLQGPPYTVGRDDLLQYNISNASFQKAGKFINPVLAGLTGTDGHGTCYQIGGSRNEKFVLDIYDMYFPVPKSTIFSFSAQKPSPVRLFDLPVPLASHSTASDGNGSIYILGGHNSISLPYYESPSLAIYKYNTATQTTEVKGKLTKGLKYPPTVWVNGALYIFGGKSYSPDSIASNEIFKFTPGNGPNGKIEVTGAKLDPWFPYGSVVAVGTDVYLFGGFGYKNRDADFQLYKFDALTNVLVKVPVSFPRIHFMYKKAFFNPRPVYIPTFKRIYIFGGVFPCGDASDLIFYFQL